MKSAADQRAAKRDDRRAFRFSAGLAAAYRMYDNWYDCEMLDVSSGGAAIETKQALLRNDAVRLKVTCDGRTAFLDARVAYSVGTRTGLVFEQRDRDGIEGFLTIVDDILEEKARIEVREHIKRHGVLKFPVRVSS